MGNTGANLQYGIRKLRNVIKSYGCSTGDIPRNHTREIAYLGELTGEIENALISKSP